MNIPNPEQSLTCRRCKARSAWSEGFLVRNSVIHGPHHVCVTCHLYREKYQRYYLSWMYWTAVLTALSYYFADSLLLAVGLAAAVYAILYTAIVVHELAHLAAARLTGVRVAAISFGGGLRGAVFRLGDTFVTISPTPTEGMVVPIYSSAARYRLQAFLILAAGPSANLLAAATLGAILLSFGPGIHGGVRVALAMATGINAAVGLSNLAFFTHRTAFGPQKSDGAQIRELFNRSAEQIEEAIRAGNVVRALLEFQLGDRARALQIVEQEIAQGNVTMHTRTLITAALAETGDLDRAIVLAKEYLADESLELLEKTVLQNNLAYALLIGGIESHLHEADRLSAIAYNAIPMLLAIRSTRGAVLAATGRFREGIDLLSDKRFRLESPLHRARVRATLSKARACEAVQADRGDVTATVATGH
jgi:hypothetical protein